ncbi:hypothetical protein [Bacillus multifaciens]|uniref:hypothetical protein n=1 Tax=Bacillus multifaciens TaxID=3068506 RepID=UPI0027408CAC|nr:hypothetical protein [Bacillus sp. WLY-B-L8]MDP7980473.1 hypothetical protein [Bacillus sp. WLY-B-L8]
MQTRIFHTADLTLAAALSTIKGAKLGHVTVTRKGDDGYLVTFEIAYKENSHTEINDMIERYKANTLQLNVRSLSSQLAYCRYLFSLKTRQYQNQM